MFRTALCIALAFSLAGPAFAQVSSTSAAPPPAAGSGSTLHPLMPNAGAASHLVNMNLTSTVASVVASSGGQSSATMINVGGAFMKVLPATQLTPAEYLAALQVWSGQPQAMLLDRQGAAVGGNVVVGDGLTSSLSALVVPKNVSLTSVTTTGVLSIAGDLVDHGAIYITAANQTSLGSLSLNAANVVVTGLLSAPQNIPFNVTATGAVNNSGTIYSGSDLSIRVGSGHLTNTGLISSANGSIHIDALAPDTNINVTARGGTFSAPNGVIAVRDSAYNGVGDVSLRGGNYLSQALNLYSGTGAIDGALGRVTGMLNTAANIAHLSAATDTLTLGSQCLTGDPTYINTSGNININGAMSTSGNDIAIIASGSIIGGPGASITTAGGDALLIAGAAATTSSTQNPANASVSVDLNSGPGGNVDFSGSLSAMIDTSNTSGRGGSVTILAHANGLTGGRVLFAPGDTIYTPGTTGGGNVQILAGGNSGIGLNLPSVDTSGSNGSNGGSISAISTNAVTSDGQPLQVTQNGSILPINRIVPGAMTSLNISFGQLFASAAGTLSSPVGGRGGDVAIVTQGSVSATGSILTNGSGSVDAGGSGGVVTVVAGNSIGLLDVTANGAISQGTTNAGGNGGVVVLTSSNGSVSVGSIVARGGTGSFGSNVAAGGGGNGGTVSIFGQSAVNVTGAFDLSGGMGGGSNNALGGNGGNGGSILLNSRDIITLSKTLTVNGGAAPFSVQPGVGGHGGSIGVHASLGITQDTSKSLNAAGGQQGASGNYSYGDGGDVVLSSTSGDIQVGNIDASSAGPNPSGVFASGSGGHVLIFSNGNVSVGDATRPVAAVNASGPVLGGNGGSVSITANVLNLNGAGLGNNVVLTSGAINGGSVLLSLGAAAGNALNFNPTNPNFATTGSVSTGNVWVLGQVPAFNPYTVNNSATNNNQFVNMAVGSLTGDGVITFSSGTMPALFSPGGWTTANANNIQVNTSGDASLIVPLASRSGAFVINSLSTENSISGGGLALFSTSSISVPNVVDTARAARLDAVIANESAISISSSRGLNLGTVIAGGSLAISAQNDLAVRQEIKGQSIDLTAPAVSFSGGTSSRLRTTGGDINIAGVGLSGNLILNNSALFATAATGNVLISTAVPGNTIVFSGSHNFVSAAPNITFRAGFITSDVDVRAVGGGDITFEDDGAGVLDFESHANLYTMPGGAINFKPQFELMLGGPSAPSGTAVNVDGEGRFVVSTPAVYIRSNGVVNTTIASSGRSTMELNTDHILLDGGTQPTISTNNGFILVRPIGNFLLDSANGGPATLNLNTGSTRSSSVVDIQSGGDVTLASNMTLASDSPVQINLNAAKTVTLSSNSVLKTTFSGTAAFPDPLGGTFPYSILIQNLVTNLNVAGTGTILQAGATPGYTVFNDYVDVGFANGANIQFASTNPGSLVNFFTRQVQINGAAVTAATLSGTNVDAFNFNTNLPSFSPAGGDFAFQAPAGTFGFLTVNGAPVVVGYSGTPPAGIPANQQQLSVLNTGLTSGFSLISDNSVTFNARSMNFAPSSGISTGSATGTITLQSDGDLAISSIGTINLVTAGGAVNLLANSSPSSRMSLALTALVTAPSLNIQTPNLAFSGLSSVQGTGNVDVKTGIAVTPMKITALPGSNATLQAGGLLLLHPEGNLEFATSGGALGTLNLQSTAGLVNIQAVGDVTLDNNFQLQTQAPLQFNFNAAKTLTLSPGSAISTTFSGTSTFPDPLGGFFDYSILVQNLITNLNVAGTGSISLLGAQPGNLVFNDFVDVGFAHQTSISVSSAQPGSYVNFFTRQIQVNSDGINPAATAALHAASNIAAFNFNTNLPAPVAGDVAFQPGVGATSATLNITGAPVNIGFPSGTPGPSIPAVQQPVGILTVGLFGKFDLTAPALTANANSIQIWNGSSVNTTNGTLALSTLTTSNLPILLNGTLTAPGQTVDLAVHGSGNLLNLGGLISADAVNLSAGTGNLGSALIPVEIQTTSVSANSAGGSAFLHTNQAVNLTTSDMQAGDLRLTSDTGGIGVQGNVNGNFVILNAGFSPVAVNAGVTLQGHNVFLTTTSVQNSGTIKGGMNSGDGIAVSNNSTDPLLLLGNGTWVAPQLLSLDSKGGINVGNLFSVSQPLMTHEILIRSVGTTTLPVNALSVTPDSVSGQGGRIRFITNNYTFPQASLPLSLTANGTTSGGTVDLEISGTTARSVAAGGNITISAHGGGGLGAVGHGGTVTVLNGGNLTVDTIALQMAPATTGDGGTLDLEAGTGAGGGKLVVKGALTLDGRGASAAGGSVTLASNSTTVFTLGSKTALNGTQGAVSVAGAGGNGSVRVNNLGGGITTSQNFPAISAFLLSTGNNGAIKIGSNIGSATTGFILLDANGKGTVTGGAANLILAQQVDLRSGSGAITVADINVPAAAVTVVNSSTSGTVAVTNPGSGTIDVAANGSTVTLSAPKGSIITEAIGSTTVPSTVSVTAFKDITNAGPINALTSLTEKTTATSGASRIGGTGNLIVSGPKGSVTMTNSGSGLGSGINMSGATMVVANDVTLTASKGDLSLGTVNAGGKISGTAFNKIDGTAGTVTGTLGVTLKTTAITGPDKGSITLGSVFSGTGVAGTVGGVISVTAAGGTITVAPSASIVAFSDKVTKATITLQNNSKVANADGIVVGANADIETKGLQGSTVTLTMGAPVAKNTTLPSVLGLHFTPSSQPTPPVFFFGTNSVQFNTTALNQAFITSTNGGKVIFNTGTLPASTIKINGGAGTGTIIKAVGSADVQQKEFVLDTNEDDSNEALTLLPQ